LLIFVCILFPAGFLLQDSKAAVWGLEILAFVASFTALHVLDGRQQRRQQKRD
jgi:hypothetical protein